MAEINLTDEQIRAHAEKCTLEVATWPSYKRNIFQIDNETHEQKIARVSTEAIRARLILLSEREDKISQERTLLLNELSMRNQKAKVDSQDPVDMIDAIVSVNGVEGTAAELKLDDE